MEIERITCPAMTAYTLRARGSVKDMGKTIKELFVILRDQNLEFGGQVFSIYYEEPKGNDPFDYAVCATIGGVVPAGIPEIHTYGGTRSVHAEVKGSYKKLEEAWKAVEAFIEENHIEVTGEPIEVYTKGPLFGFLPIPFLLVTDIYVPAAEPSYPIEIEPTHEAHW